ncbi:MAG TPA: BON domain-containing protein [Alphaproteobacteria bacterium]|nr:BON domain-containing protein [Alphaproteobacteria bacterium]
MRRLATLAVLASTILSACVPVALGTGAGYVGLQDRPVGQTTEDTGLKIGIKNNLAQVQGSWLTDIGIDVYYGDVLLTGIVATRAEGEKVLDIVRRTEGVKRVYNELFVGAAYSAAQRARDGWIATQIQPRLFGASDAYPLNYLITVVNNNVYIMGSTGSSAEHEHVLHVLRTTRGVAQVHDYLTVANSNTAGQPPVKRNTFGSGASRQADPLADSDMN